MVVFWNTLLNKSISSCGAREELVTTEERSATLGQLKGSTLHRSCSRQTASKGKQHHTCLLLTSHPRLLLTHSADSALMGWVFKCSLLQNAVCIQWMVSLHGRVKPTSPCPLNVFDIVFSEIIRTCRVISQHLQEKSIFHIRKWEKYIYTSCLEPVLWVQCCPAGAACLRTKIFRKNVCCHQPITVTGCHSHLPLLWSILF